MRPSLATQKAIYGRLAGDTILNGLLGTPAPTWAKNIYYQHAAENAGHPFVIFDKQSSNPIETLAQEAVNDSDSTGSKRAVIENEVWLVRVTDRSDNNTILNHIAERIETLLNDYLFTGQISGRTVLYSRRISDTDFTEVLDGSTYRHAGLVFRIYHQPS